MYYYTLIQIADINAKVRIFEQMENQVKGYYPVENAVDSMAYALYYYPANSAYQIKGSRGEFLMETLRRNSVQRMVATLKERFPESCKGNSPFAWTEAYADPRRTSVDYWRETEWYKKWYADMED